VVFMGTPEFAVPVLDCLIQSEYQVVAVYTQPDRPAGRRQGLVSSVVKEAALVYGLQILQPTSLKQPEEKERLADLHPDVIIVAAFGQLLPQSILDIPPFGCLNIHFSLLPKHRGPAPVAAAILAGDKVSGVSIMLMDKGFDTGPILAQEQTSILPQDTTESLSNKLAHVGAQLLIKTLPLWLEGHLTPQPQIETEATYSKTITKEDGEIDWHLSAVELWQRLRAFQPWPGCYTRWQGKLIKIIKAIPLPEVQGGKPGQVVVIRQPQGTLVGVQTAEGVLQLLQVQLEGKRAMSAEEFIRGQRSFTDALLPS
jgi:methionyl-tRNA formyltransferase